MTVKLGLSVKELICLLQSRPEEDEVWLEGWNSAGDFVTCAARDVAESNADFHVTVIKGEAE